MSNIEIVAEIGCNHNGDVELAKKMVKAAADANVDAVKFQMFKTESLVSTIAPKAEYQKIKNQDETQYQMLKKLEISQADYISIKQYAESLNIEMFSTPFDIESICFLENLGQRIWKIPSGEITNLPYLERIRDVLVDNKEIVLSTGMSSMNEIIDAVAILKKSKKTNFTILHCNTEYPTSDQDMNLRALHVLKKFFPDWNVGLSDHSSDIVASIVAAGMGISFIEKHFTLDKNLPGPDHKASITPDELNLLCSTVRRAEIMLGTESKFVTESEVKNKFIARKSIVAKKKIYKGDVFSEDNITCKRPGNGISPMKWYQVIGKQAERDFEYDSLIECNGVKREDEYE